MTDTYKPWGEYWENYAGVASERPLITRLWSNLFSGTDLERDHAKLKELAERLKEK